MILDIFKLIFGGFVGINVSAFNMQLVTFNQVIDCHMSIINPIIGLLVGLLTIVFLILQIRKICLDIQEKIKKREHEN